MTVSMDIEKERDCNVRQVTSADDRRDDGAAPAREARPTKFDRDR